MPPLPRPVRVPPTKLWDNHGHGNVIVLECICGYAVPYPGHPDNQPETTCSACGTRYVVEPVSRVTSQGA